MKNFQVAIIGGGVIGCAIAWELSKYNVDVILFEKGCDVASVTSKANSGVIHSGINSKIGSRKADFCVKGNSMFQNLANQLGFQLKWIGKLVIAKNQNEVKELYHLKKTGETNNVAGLKIIEGSEINQKEKYVCGEKALWVPTAGIILPYEFTIALAENAVENNVNIKLETTVKEIKKHDDYFQIITNKGIFHVRLVINAAGLQCKNIVSMLEDPDFDVYPCRGEYLILDTSYSFLANSMIYPIPDKKLGVLGVHITPTIEGNILLGPSAEYIDDPDDTSTTKEMMKTILDEAKKIIPCITSKSVISAYSGIRCKLAPAKPGSWADYRIEESKNTPGLINLIGIESPGLTAAPAIACEVASMISKYITLKKKKKFVYISNKRERFSQLTINEKDHLIQKDKRYGRIICRCEHVTEKEVIDALSNPLGATTLSSVKYRCRAGMGRCQGGFCTQHIVRIMQQHCTMDIKDMKLKSPQSYLFERKSRKNVDE
ncbi:MAG: NAD(P)/FAD-dependent oxidoreductase [Thermoplasmatota archaeon]